ncbi:MAG: outer membrane protein assembly factor BamA, partial [Deltaproteobacteria bacterium]|nr:outer membrane protein assembly factor BamA [Deltaproteobacteria bacterium]
MKLFALVALSVAVPVPAGAADKVIEIKVEGARRVEPEAALGRIKTKVGEPLDDAVLTEDLRQVWNTGFFRDVRIERQRVEGGVRLVFVVVEKPSIREVKYSGRDDLSEDDVKGVVDVKPYTILNIDQLKKNVEKIRDLYIEKGYYLAQVSFRFEPVPDSEHEVFVFFDIVENAKVMVKQLSFIGNKHLKSEQIAGVLQTREGSELSWLSSSGTYKEEFFQTDLFRIQALYYDHGFVSVKVGQPTATISPDRRYIYLAVPIEEGE